jgi:hypothetical protein
VAAALTAPRGFDRCLLILAGGAELWDRISQDDAEAIAGALKTPGHAVAVVGLRRLVAEKGVIARLEAMGLRVKGPGEGGRGRGADVRVLFLTKARVCANYQSA